VQEKYRIARRNWSNWRSKIQGVGNTGAKENQGSRNPRCVK
jgi:hypothetical protein